MNLRKLTFEIQNEIRNGADRQEIFDRYRSQTTNPKRLATLIAQVPDEARKSKYRGLNRLLVVLLLMIGILHTIGLFSVLNRSASPTLLRASIIIEVLSAVLPFAFAYLATQFVGTIYTLTLLISFVWIIRAFPFLSVEPLVTGIILLLLITVMVLCGIIHRGLFPHLGFFGVKKKENGDYELGANKA